MNKALIDQLATLSSDERLQLAYGLLDSVIEERDAPTLSDAQRRGLRARHRDPATIADLLKSRRI